MVGNGTNCTNQQHDGASSLCACVCFGETIQTAHGGRNGKRKHAQDFSAAILGTALQLVVELVVEFLCSVQCVGLPVSRLFQSSCLFKKK